MQDPADHIIAMLLPAIGQSFTSFKTLNLLARTNKTISLATKDHHLVSTMAKNSKTMTKKALRKLFVLPASVKLSYCVSLDVYRLIHIIPRCRVLHAFEQAMVTHGSVARMAEAVCVRERRSTAMKLVWQEKKHQIAMERQARIMEVEQIHSDLFIVPCNSYVKTDAEMIYVEYGVVRRLSRVYRNKRMMALHSAGLLHIGGGVVNSFLRVARLDMNDRDSLTHSEKLLILRHSLAWEHFLFNYTSFTDVLREVAGTIVDVDHVEFLFPLPTKWPFATQIDESILQTFDTADLPGMFQQWLVRHDHLYEDP
jgi:hypothetical protein